MGNWTSSYPEERLIGNDLALQKSKSKSSRRRFRCQCTWTFLWPASFKARIFRATILGWDSTPLARKPFLLFGSVERENIFSGDATRRLDKATTNGQGPCFCGLTWEHDLMKGTGRDDNLHRLGLERNPRGAREKLFYFRLVYIVHLRTSGKVLVVPGQKYRDFVV